MRTSTNDEASFGRNLWPAIQEGLQMNHARFTIIPTFVHPQTSREKVKAYFLSIMPDQIGCLESVLPSRTTFENFNREGLTLTEYANGVKNNSRLYKQARTAVRDMETIAKEVIQHTKE